MSILPKKNIEDFYGVDLLDFIEKYIRTGKINDSTKSEIIKFTMLCGKQVNDSIDNRKITKDLFSRFRKDIKNIMSEECFEFQGNLDLLTFEEILAEISDAVIIYIESMGSACELGAFAYVDSMLSKLLVINDLEYRGAQSFINDGPIKKIVNKDEKSVVYTKFNDEKLISLSDTNLVSSLLSCVPEVKELYSQDFCYSDNILEIKINYFVLLLIDVVNLFEPITIVDSTKLIKYFLCKNQNCKLNFSLESTNKLNEIEIIEIIFKLLEKWQVIEKKVYKKGYIYRIDRKQQYDTNGNPNYDIGKVLFQKKFFDNEKILLNLKSKIIYINKKAGRELW
ncbi:MAG: retron St85 family effector protein [Bacilli bacterium]|nr:retron St85 family effector protein [Bacilli bacterium]MDD4411077.1 retron St85 family effector protein [Bacilli bacterium]